MSDAPATFRIVASDMDGTLLNSAHKITPYTMETLFQLSVRFNVKFIFATGRHHLSVHDAWEALSTYFAQRYEEYHAEQIAAAESSGKTPEKSAAPGFFLVTSNGARIHDPQGKLIVQHNLDPEIVRALYLQYGLPYTARHGPDAQKEHAIGSSPYLAQPPTPVPEDAEVGAREGDDEHPEETVSTSTYTTDAWYITVPFMPLPEMEKKFGVRPFVVPFDAADPANATRSVFDEFPLEDVGKVCFRCSDKHILDRMEHNIKLQFGDRVSVALSSTCCLDVMASGISKASALKEVVSLLSSQAATHDTRVFTMDDVISFGDSMNDEEMLAAAGKGCVMRNAQERLKKCLPQCEVIRTNEQNGVAVKLREIFHMEV
uniref:Haloacid dehalogenase-like hydrolase-like protein n=1 Tax=Angomonas deanei TaxID=59799 RepID=C6K3T4_9TRYP|nr:haloacid dehalogenase-like hydrolase-like protein [Angomonas deanei]